MDYEPDLEMYWNTGEFCMYCNHYENCPKEWYCRTFIKMVMEHENVDDDDTDI